MTTILVIEDETAIREKILTVLQYEGFDVLEACDGAEGVGIAREHRPDLILCDILMPEMSGYCALSSLRASSETSSIPVIFLTAAASRVDMRKGMELGADDYITKPYTVEELLTAVRTRLERQAVIRANGETGAGASGRSPDSSPASADR